MFKPFSKTCIALTWNEIGDCRGVRLSRRGGRLSVDAYWRCMASEINDLSVALSRGVQALYDDNDSLIVVGSTGSEFGFIDLSMPDLDSDNLRKALRFELGKQAPVNDDKLVWGFRVLGSGDDKRVWLRLAYLPEIQWGHLVDKLGSLARKIDAIIPAPAALDPTLAETPLFIKSESENGNDCLFMPGEQGRELLFNDGSGQTAFGAGDRPLALRGLEIGPLADLPAGEQQSFASAVVLAMYGTSSSLRTDRKTWFSVPQELQPQRHRFARRAAVLLTVYITLILVFGLGRGYIEGSRQLRTLESRQADVRSQINQLASRESPSQFVDALRGELGALNLEQATLLQCLLELTDKIPDDYWISNFNWQEGKIDIQIQSTQDDLIFLEKLRESLLLTDVLPIRKNVDHQNNVTFQVQMRSAPGGNIDD